MQTKPTSAQLARASNIDRELRDWVNRRIDERLAAIPKPRQLKRPSCDRTSQVDELIQRVAELERRYAEDDKFALTKAKLMSFMKKAGFD